MKIEGKNLTPILLVLVALLLCLAVFALFSLKGEKSAKINLQDKLKQADSMIQTFQTRLDKSNKTVLEFTEQINDREIQIASLTSELDSVKTNTEAAISERDSLKLELENLKVSKQELLERLSIAEKELGEVKSELSAISKEKNSLERKLKDLQASTGIDLDKIVVSYSDAEEGKILEINDDFDFIVVDLGQEDNITIGQTFYIYQGGNFIGEAGVDKVHEMMSIATLKDSGIKSTLKEGDTVKLK